MKKASDVFNSIRYAKVAPKGKPHKSTDDEEHGTVGEKEYEDQIKHVKKMAGMAEEKKDKYDEGEYDREGDMAKSDLRSIIANAQKLHDMIDDADNLPEWCQSKITVAEDYMSTVANYMTAEMNEEVIEEGRPSQRHPLEGHDYHKKTDAQLEYIAKDAHKAAEAMKSHNTNAENKYRDQANDSATVRYWRKKHGMPDWYKKKYGHMKEEVEQIEEVSSEMLDRYKEKAKKSADELTAKGQHKKSTDRWGNIMKATGKQIEKTTASIKKALNKEEVEYLEEKNEPTNPELWARAKSMAKSKFDVYPSAYANGWAAKWYKSKGGGWKSVSEAYNTVSPSSYDDHPMVAFRKKENEMKKNQEVPFDGPYKKASPSVTDKSGAKHGPMSTVRHLARQAMKKQVDKMKPVKESLDESRKAEIVKEIVKKKKEQNDKFESNPVLTSQIVKEDK